MHHSPIITCSVNTGQALLMFCISSQLHGLLRDGFSSISMPRLVSANLPCSVFDHQIMLKGFNFIGGIPEHIVNRAHLEVRAALACCCCCDWHCSDLSACKGCLDAVFGCRHMLFATN
jgi:hypothetical protein